MKHNLRLRQNTQSWTFSGQTEPRVSGVFYCLRLYRLDNGNGSVLERTSQNGLKFNPATGAFSISIPFQDAAVTAGDYAYELTETLGSIVTILQRGRLTISAVEKSTANTAPASTTNTSAPNPTSSAEELDAFALYEQGLRDDMGSQYYLSQ